MRTFSAHETSRMKELEGIKLAPFSRRAISFAIDIFIAVILMLLIYLPYAYYSGKISSKETYVVTFNFENWYSIAATIIYFGLATYFGNGQTLGKRLMKIRVLSLTHSRVSFWQSIERSLGYGASMLEVGFGFVQFFINKNRRTVHDRIAETIVVDER